jgi:SAM-dependent methyltransferase
MSEQKDAFEAVENHYTLGDLENVILNSLADSGKDLNALTPEDLAPIDEFHIRGREATLQLAHRLNLDEKHRVLDVGSGLGGASRHLTLEFGCHVTGIDLTEEYCTTAQRLSQLLGIDNRVEYRYGNALNMPFEDEAFDVVLTIHTAMNIAEKDKLYQEMWRVLKSGGSLAIYDILQGSGGELFYPVPWAKDQSTSFLATPQELRHQLEENGFEIDYWKDVTEAGLKWFEAMAKWVQQQGRPQLGFHLLLDDFATMAKNQLHNLREGRIVLIETIAKKV